MKFETEFNYLRFQQYLDFLKASGTSSATIDRKLSSLNSFQTFLIKKHYLTPPPKNSPNSNQNNNFFKRIFISPQSRGFFHKTKGFEPKRNFLSRYLIFGTLISILLGLSYGIYSQAILKAKKELAYSTASTPVRAGRILSFQGRLTDSNGNPISSSTDILFKLYTAGTGGTELYTSSIGNSQTVIPDDNGIFSVVIGKSHGTEIPPEVFSENAEVWLEITAGGEIMNPRQQIATVGYALNSETLQGLPPSASGLKDTVLVIDNLGNLNLGETSPTIKSTSGTLGIEGQALLMNAVNGLDTSNIKIDPTSSNGAIQLITTGNGSSNSIVATNANLATGNLITGKIVNDNRGYNFLNFQNYDLGTTNLSTRFSIGASGNVYISDSLTTNGAVTFTGLPVGTGNTIIYINSSGNLVSGTLPTSTIYTADNGITLNGSNFSLGGNLNKNTTIGTSSFSLSFQGESSQSLYLAASGKIGMGTTNPANKLQVSSDYYQFAVSEKDNPNHTFIYDVNGSNFHFRSANDDLSSAIIRMRITWNGDIDFRNSTGNENMIIKNSGFVGIGNTNPSRMLDVQGDIAGNKYYDLTDSNLFLDIANADPNSSSLSLERSGSIKWNSYYKTIGTSAWSTISNGYAAKIENDLSKGLLFATSNIATSETSITWNQNLFLQGNSGYVGIGTTNPNANLEVLGKAIISDRLNAKSIDIGTTTSTESLVINSTAIGNSSVAAYLSGNSGLVGYISTINWDKNATDDYSGWNLSASSGSPQLISSGQSAYIYGENGIGTSISGTDSLIIGIGGTLTKSSFTNINIGSGSSGLAFLGINNNTQALVIRNNGNVGIGNTDPSEHLSIYKNIDGDDTISINNPNSGTGAAAALSLVSNGGTTTLRSVSVGYTAFTSAHMANSFWINTSLPKGINFSTANGGGTIRFFSGGRAPTNERLTIAADGSIGIGNTAPDNKLDVAGTLADNIDLVHFRNSGTGTSSTILALQIGNTTVGNRFINFLNNAGSAIGRVRAVNSTTITYATSGTGDFAEYIRGDEPTEPGDIIAYHSEFAGKAKPNEPLAGIYSTYGTFVAGENISEQHPYSILLAMSGITRVKINSSNGPIHPGDPITISNNIAGVGAKAISATHIVAIATESYSNPDPNETGYIHAQINLSYYDPDLFLTDSGQVNINYNISPEVLSSLGYLGSKNEIEAATYSLTDSTEKLVIRVANFAKLSTAKLTAGFITAKNLIAENIISETNKSKKISTTIISPLSDISDTITIEGDASVSGTLTTENIVATNATFSSIYTDQIISQEGNFGQVMANKIANLREEIKNLLASDSATATPSAIAIAANTWDTSIATFSSNLTLDDLSLTNNLVVGAQLTIKGQSNLNSTNISGILTVGQIAINNNIFETTSENLYIQPSGLGSIHFLNDSLVLNSDGNIIINGNLHINGSLIATLLKTDSIETKDLTAEKINISTTSAIIASALPTEAPTETEILTSNASIGTATLASGQTEITIKSNRLTPASMVYLTPNASSQNQVVYVKSKDVGNSIPSFTIGIDSTLPFDLPINWWLIN